jgi:hypothetical protein
VVPAEEVARTPGMKQALRYRIGFGKKIQYVLRVEEKRKKVSPITTALLPLRFAAAPFSYSS